MEPAGGLLLAVAVIFAVNLLPAFGPPTWSVLVFFSFTFDLPAVPLVLFGAIAAAGGRFVLANGARRLRPRMSSKRRENLAAVEQAVAGSRTRTAAGLGLFALSPLPSAQLFVAAGLLTVPLLPLTAAFFGGRIVSYSLYVGAATAAGESLEGLLAEGFSSPAGIALQIAMLAGLVALVRVDWATRLARRTRHGSRP